MLQGLEVSGAEREELEAVLKARVLARSPTVLRIAEYIARKYIEGQADSIKEYNIAVEALGKPADFDSKRDSIVRVEAHRLRKKLVEFYRTEGSSRALRVVIEPGQYVPRFEPNTPGDLAVLEAGAELNVMPVEATLAALPSSSSSSRMALIGLFVAVLIALAVSSWRFGRTPASPHATPAPDSRWLVSGSPPDLIVVAGTGAVWRGDRWFQGGAAVSAGPIAAIPEMTGTFQRQGNFNYDIPLVKAPYELRLYFGPRARGIAGQTARGFDVFANGEKLLNALDPDIGDGDRARSFIRVFHDIRPAVDGKLHLAFRNGTQTAYVNAIELTPGETGRLRPVRMVARAAPYVDPEGVTWRADGYVVSGGTLKIRTNLVSGRVDQNLVSGERYGTFTYDIPVSKGTYGLKLYFAESWFGLDGGGGVGSRRFDVYVNRMPLLQDFDIMREAGASSRAVVKQFHGLAPNADGYISLAFIPRINHACIDALELTDESAR